jgi:DNA polymerase-3 subunit epsilon
MASPADRNTQSTRQLAGAVGGVAAAFAGGTTLILFTVWAGLEGAQRDAFAAALLARLDLAIISGLFVMTLAGIAVAALFRRYVIAPQRLAEETRLITHCNPQHRLRTDGGGALALLAAEINALAAHVAELSGEVDARVAVARTDLAEEKNRLAALMEELAQGVLVCNLQGCILLYNRCARSLLTKSAAGGSVGLGRSVFGLLDRNALAGALEQAVTRLARGENNPVICFDTRLADNTEIGVRLAPVAAANMHAAAAGDSRIAGYVLTFDAIADDTAPTPAPPPIGTARLAVASAPARPAFYDFDLFNQPPPPAVLDDCALNALSYTAFDTETTGLNPVAGDEIISIGAIRIVNGKLLHGEMFDQLIDPRRAVPAAAVRIHGIGPAMLAGKPSIADVLPHFHHFCAGTVLVAHNAAFDLRFLQLKEAATGLSFDQPVLDTLMLSAVAQPQQSDHSLEAIAARLGVDIVGRHSALGDALVTGEIFLRLLPLLAAAGVTTLRQAREASRLTVYARVQY